MSLIFLLDPPPPTPTPTPTPTVEEEAAVDEVPTVTFSPTVVEVAVVLSEAELVLGFGLFSLPYMVRNSGEC